MSTLLELERMQQHVARLRRRIKNQDSEELRCALIQFEDLERHAQQGTDRTDTATDSNSNVA